MALKWDKVQIAKSLASLGAAEAERLAQYISEDFDLTNEEVIESAIQRLQAGEPYQYVSNRADFYGYQFYVDNSVLIPRPETEELVYQVLKQVKSRKESVTVLDIGTGSGCIPITLIKEHSTMDIQAIDISEDALAVARRNAKEHKVVVVFKHFDFLNDDITSLGKYDVVISNPPYIPVEEKAVMGASVIAHEPHIALFTDDDRGLEFYAKIAEYADVLLHEQGQIFLEMNEYHSQLIAQLYQSLGAHYSVEIIKDLQGKDRILHVMKNSHK